MGYQEPTCRSRRCSRLGLWIEGRSFSALGKSHVVAYVHDYHNDYLHKYISALHSWATPKRFFLQDPSPFDFIYDTFIYLRAWLSMQMVNHEEAQYLAEIDWEI